MNIQSKICGDRDAWRWVQNVKARGKIKYSRKLIKYYIGVLLKYVFLNHLYGVLAVTYRCLFW